MQDPCQNFGKPEKFFAKKRVDALKAAWLKGFIFLLRSCFFYSGGRIYCEQGIINEGKSYKPVGKQVKLHFGRMCGAYFRG